MLIFDSFPSRTDAEKFANHVKATFDLETRVFDNQNDSDKVDPFPFILYPPIVLVERPPERNGGIDDKAEENLQKLVTSFKGDFAGT